MFMNENEAKIFEQFFSIYVFAEWTKMLLQKRQLFVNIQQGLKLTFFGSVLQMIKMAGKPDGVENFVLSYNIFLF